jgi:hypothetical protein
MSKLGDEQFAAKTLWRYIQKLSAPQGAVLQDSENVIVLHATIYGSSQDALLSKVIDLVFKKKYEAGIFDSCPMTVGDYRKLKECFEKEQLYYDFLR